MDQPPQDPTQPSQPAQPAAPPPPSPAWGQPSAPPAPQYNPPPAPGGWAQPAPAGNQWIQPPAMQGPVTGLAKLGGLIITLIAALWIFLGAITVLGGALFKDFIDRLNTGTQAGDVLGGAVATIGIIVLVLAIIEFLGGLGALFGKDWGRIISIIYGLLFGVATLLIGFSALTGGRSTDPDVTAGATGAAVIFLGHGILYLVATLLLMAKWRGRATA